MTTQSSHDTEETHDTQEPHEPGEPCSPNSDIVGAIPELGEAPNSDIVGVTSEAGVGAISELDGAPISELQVSEPQVSRKPKVATTDTGKPPKAKKPTSDNGNSNVHIVTARVNSELLKRFQSTSKRAGLSDSGLLRVALEAYLDDLEERTMLAEITKAVKTVGDLNTDIGAQLNTRLDSFESRIQLQISELKALLGEPV